MNRSKVCIIGSGLGGLTCGVVLAKNGYEVTVLEQGAQVGGCLQCFARHGARFETGMHFIGSAAEGQTMHRVMSYLELNRDVRLSQLDTTGYEVVGIGGQRYKFANGREKFIEQMAARFPTQRDNLERYFDAVELAASPSAILSKQQAPATVTIGSDYQLRSINSVIDTLITDPLLAKVLVGNLPLYAAVPDKTPFATHAFVTHFYNQSAYRIAGGSDRMARSLAATIARYGGSVLTRHKATKIVCDDSRATGVQTDTGEHFAADYVIAAIHPARVLELTDSKLLRPAYRQRIGQMTQTPGVFAVYLEFEPGSVAYMNHNYYGYDTDTPWGCEHYDEESWPKGFMYMHFCDSAGAGGQGSWQSPPPAHARAAVIISYMQMADVEQWRYTTTGHRGQAYEDFKQRKADKLMAALERHFPGITSKVIRRHTSTPLTYRDYTGTEDGSMYGVAKDISTGSAGRVTHRTKIPNLLLAGQNVNSHGMQGVIVGTIVTCRDICQHINLQR